MNVQSIFKARRIDNGQWVEGRLIADNVIVPTDQFFRVVDNVIYGGPFTAYKIDPRTVTPELKEMWHNNLEEKPLTSGEYLCCCLFGECGNFKHKQIIIEYDAYNNTWECDYNIVISHWMDLPDWPLKMPEPSDLPPCDRPPHRPPHDKPECDRPPYDDEHRPPHHRPPHDFDDDCRPGHCGPNRPPHRPPHKHDHDCCDDDCYCHEPEDCNDDTIGEVQQ